ncbi:MAG: hypothetical protein D3916_15740, partial [Candidatus Electrothrix sp. MAN1_4]|nr:hypothetical protein [Candidatus Electrothrix sp. MAN1_4]
NYGSPIILCKDGTADSCSGTDKSWSEYNIDPTQYGVTSSDTFKLILTVRDEDGNLDYVDYHEVSWSPEPPTSGPSGSITSPGSTAEGDFTVRANAEDPAGLEKVSVIFPSGDTLVLCEDGTSTSCSGTSDSWSKSITPADYGMTNAGTYSLSLWVSNEDGDSPERVDTHTVTWSPETPPSSGSTGSITSPGSSAEGNFTISCNANDPAGLEKVSVVFPSGDTLVLCEDGTTTSCSGISDSWTEFDINPAEYGITSEGTYTLSLWVVNEDADPATRVDTQTVNWSPEPAPVNTPPSGSFMAPSDLVNGLVTVQATASDADGLKKVSAVFVPNGTPLVLCDDTSSHTCSGTSGSWEVAGINPADYGASAGNIILGLHVQDESDGNTETLTASTEFTWIPPNNQFPKDSTYFNVCVGHNYEQQMPLEGTTMPSVSFADAPASIRSGENVVLHTNGSVDTANGGSPFYYYCTRQGSLLYDDAQPDQVTWIAPMIPGYSESVKLYVQIGDGLGYIDSEVKTVNV